MFLLEALWGPKSFEASPQLGPLLPGSETNEVHGRIPVAPNFKDTAVVARQRVSPSWDHPCAAEPEEDQSGREASDGKGPSSLQRQNGSHTQTRDRCEPNETDR